MKKRWKKLGTGIGLLAAAAGIALAVYTGDYYHASETALTALIPDEAVQVETLSGGVAFVPREVEAGLIFYPGGKVEYTAYAPLMRALAEEGVLCVITKMPLNLSCRGEGQKRDRRRQNESFHNFPYHRDRIR